MKETDMHQNSFALVAFVLKHLKLLLTITFSAAVVSTVVSLFIDNEYKSVVVLYPSNTSSISKVLINQAATKGDLLEFGEEEKTEQLLQVLHSDIIRSEIIKKFDLMNHYQIDTTSEIKQTLLFEKFEDKIKFKRNEYMAVEIIVYDTDPKTAANIANEIKKTLDDVMNNIQKERALPAFKIVEKSYFDYLKYIQDLEDSLKFIMGKGVHDVEKQSEVLTQAYAEAIGKGNKTTVDAINEKMETLSKYGAQQYNLKEKLQNSAIQLSLLKDKYDQAKIDANERIPNFFVVNNAMPAEKKSYPIRWIIVTTTSICSFIFILLLLLFSENIKNIKITK